MLRNIIDLNPLRNDSTNFTSEFKLEFLNYVTNKTISLFTNKTYSWKSSKHRDFVSQRLNLGENL